MVGILLVLTAFSYKKLKKCIILSQIKQFLENTYLFYNPLMYLVIYRFFYFSLCLISTVSPHLSPQLDAMMEAGVDQNRIYEDMASGRKDDRPGLNACLKALQPGNTLVIWKLDRLGRDLKHLVKTLDDLRTRNVGLKVLAGAGAQIDTTTSNGRMFFGIFAVLAEFERELIVERTQAGLAAARARGRKGGRPCKMDRTTLMMAMTALANPKSNAGDVAKGLGITTTTLYVYVNGDGSAEGSGTSHSEPRY